MIALTSLEIQKNRLFVVDSIMDVEPYRSDYSLNHTKKMFCRNCIINERIKPDILLIVAGYHKQRLHEPEHDIEIQAF